MPTVAGGGAHPRHARAPVVSDPTSPQFDLEKYLLSLAGPAKAPKH